MDISLRKKLLYQNKSTKTVSKKKDTKKEIKKKQKYMSTEPAKRNHKDWEFSKLTYGMINSTNLVRVGIYEEIESTVGGKKTVETFLKDSFVTGNKEKGWEELLIVLSMLLLDKFKSKKEFDSALIKREMLNKDLRIVTQYGTLELDKDGNIVDYKVLKIGDTGYFIESTLSAESIYRFIAGFIDIQGIKEDNLKFDLELKEGKEVYDSTVVVDNIDTSHDRL